MQRRNSKSLVFIAGKVDRQKLFHSSENTNNYGCHGNRHVGALRTSVVFFSLWSARLRSFPSIAHFHCAWFHTWLARALENGGFFFTAGPPHRVKSSFLRKQVQWPIIFFCCLELSNKFLYVKQNKKQLWETWIKQAIVTIIMVLL